MKDSTRRKELRTHAEDLPISLPPEIWHKIISFTVRSSLGSRIDLEDAFEATYRGADEFADSNILSDRKSLARVSSSWRIAVAEISAECLTINSGKTLATVVEAFEHSKTQKNRSGRHLGEMTRRIDVRGFSDWEHDNTYNAQLARLLKCTPNLLIYTQDDLRIIPEPVIIAQEVLETLITYCGRSLRRIGWKTMGQLLNYQNLVKLCNASPDLVTLSLSSIVSINIDSMINSSPNEHGPASLLYFPKLKTLSLSSMPDRVPVTVYSWDYFVQRLSLDSKQLPSLERFQCNHFPPNAMSFFHVHGHKIRQLQTTLSFGNNIPRVMDLCPNLTDFFIDGCNGESKFPSAHPTLERIYIRSIASSIPLDYLLRSIEEMNAPCLKKVQLGKDALHGIIDYRLRSWWGRLDVRGIRLANEMGASFDDVLKPVYIDSDPDYNSDDDFD